MTTHPVTSTGRRKHGLPDGGSSAAPREPRDGRQTARTDGAPPGGRTLLRGGMVLAVTTMAAGAFVIVGLSANAPLVRADLGLSQTGVGAIASFGYVGAMLTSRLAGSRTDRHGPRVVMSIGLAVLALGAATVAVSPALVAFYAGVLVCGLGYGAINPATTVLANTPTARRRGLAMSLKQSGVPIGGSVAGAVLPGLGAVLGWRWSLVLPLVVVLGMAVLVWSRRDLRAGRPQPVPRTATRPVPQQVAGPASGPALRPGVTLSLPLGYAYGLVMAGVQVTVFAFLAVYLVEARGQSPGRAGLGLSLLLAAGILARPAWGWVSDRRQHDRVRVLQGLSLMAAAGLAVLPLLPLPLVPAGLVVVGLCSVGWNGVYVATVAEATPPEEVGATTGSSLVLVNLGAVVFPLAVGTVLEHTGSWRVGWWAAALLTGCAVAVAGFSRRPRLASAGPAERCPTTGGPS